MIPIQKTQEKIQHKKERRQKTRGFFSSLGWVFLAIFLGFSIIKVWWYSAEYITAKFPNPSERGTFGDQFGAINALFSGLAFAGIIITILLQGRELSLQRKELEQTRDVFNQQKFETTFFQLLKLIQDNLANIKIKNSVKQDEKIVSEFEYNGSDANYMYYKQFYKNKFQQTNIEINIERHKFYSKLFFKELNSTFNVFLFSIQNSLKFIYISNIENKSFYFDLLKGQLTDADKIIIFLHILDENNSEFKKRVVDSELIKGIESEDLFCDKNQKMLYITTVNTLDIQVP